MTERNTEYTHGLSLPDAFTCGQLFAFSGMDGENSRIHDWCGVLTGNPGEIRFTSGDSSDDCILLRYTERSDAYDVVLPDLIAAENGGILVTFADAQTIVGRSDGTPAVRLESEEYIPGSRSVSAGRYAFCLAVRQTESGVRFALCRRPDAASAEADAQTALQTDADARAKRVLDWYLDVPPCPDAKYEKLWYKCLSVNRAHVYSPPGDQPLHSTAADRLHGVVRTQDACRHASAMAIYAPEIANDTLLTLLQCQRADGFIPQTADSGDSADALYPPMLCASVWNLFEVTRDTDLLRRTVQPLRKYLNWTFRNRRSPNGLMTRHAQGSTVAEEPLESVEYSVLTVYELMCMQQIYMALGIHTSALETEGIGRELAIRINTRLWDKQTYCYYDRTFGGAFRRTVKPASFLPLFAGLCDPRQAHLLLQHLTRLLDCPFPLADAVERPQCSVQLDRNYLVYIGLQRYGFGKQAAELRRKSLDGVNRLFLKTGTVFACYDPSGGTPQTEQADAADSNLTACFTELFLFG